MIVKFCVECGHELTKYSNTEYRCDNGHFFWNNPKPTATVIIPKNGKILASVRGVEPEKGKLDVPGGFLEYGENAIEGAKREVKEETELIIDDLQFLGTYEHEYGENASTSTCDMVFLATKWHGKPVANDDVESLHWKPVSVINSKQFAWSYPGLADKLEKLL